MLTLQRAVQETMVNKTINSRKQLNSVVIKSSEFNKSFEISFI